MNVDVDKIKDQFLNEVSDAYNAEVYFVASCHKFPNKYAEVFSLMDLSLRIFFEENNNICLNGKTYKYCNKGTKRKLKLSDISCDIHSPDITINNYINEDVWNQTDW